MIFNKNILKQLFFTIPSTLILTIIFVIICGVCLTSITDNALLNCILILVISELIAFGQMVYLMIHTSKCEKFDLNKKIAWIIALYMLHIFVIPIYTYKYILEDKNFKIKSLIHIILSSFVILFTIICFIILIFESFIELPTKYKTKDGLVEVTVEGGYEIRDTDYDLYLTNESKQLTTAFFTYDLSIYNYTEDDILYYQISFFEKSRENFRLHKNVETIDLGNKKITYLEYLGTMEGYDESLYRFATVSFDEDESFILYAIQVIYPEAYDEYNDELFEILESAEML